MEAGLPGGELETDAMPSLFRLIAASALVLAASAGVANAAPGIASVSANVRAGPGTGYSVVGRLRAGQYVVVSSCGASWCKIFNVGINGYVSRALVYNPYYGSRRFYAFPPATPGPGRIVTR
jgi:uncharacterized protein YraI